MKTTLMSQNIARDWDKALAFARQLQTKKYERVRLSTSFGIGSTRILAKMEEENKPAGIHRHYLTKLRTSLKTALSRNSASGQNNTRLAEWGINTMSEAAEYGEILGQIYI